MTRKEAAAIYRKVAEECINLNVGIYCNRRYLCWLHSSDEFCLFGINIKQGFAGGLVAVRPIEEQCLLALFVAEFLENEE